MSRFFKSAAPVAIRPDLKVTRPSDASESTVASGPALALNEPMAVPSTFSFENSLARGLSNIHWLHVVEGAHDTGLCCVPGEDDA